MTKSVLRSFSCHVLNHTIIENDILSKQSNQSKKGIKQMLFHFFLQLRSLQNKYKLKVKLVLQQLASSDVEAS